MFSYKNDVKLAVSAMRMSKGRSFLTVLGIIIGIVSVVSMVAIAEGVKHQVTGQINQLGKDLITIRPGQLKTQGRSSIINDVNIFSPFNNISTLVPRDVNVVQSSSGVKVAVPLSVMGGNVQFSQSSPTSPLILGTTDQLLPILNQTMAYGEFFSGSNLDKNVAVIGQQAAEQYFGEKIPLGHSFMFQGQQFVVIGILNQFDSAPLSLNADFNNAIFISNNVAEQLTNNTATIYEILAKPTQGNRVAATITTIKHNLQQAHAGQNDFSVLGQNESLAVTNGVLALLTDLVVGIAIIALLVGGVGIMNVTLVSVTERTREIGIRKAIGAANRQILGQFVIEATVLSITGGVLGIAGSFLVNYLLRVFTDLHPIITWQMLVIASAVSLFIGIIFGAIPAIQAARKDPIDALRFE